MEGFSEEAIYFMGEESAGQAEGKGGGEKHIFYNEGAILDTGASLVAQWGRICLPMQETQGRSLCGAGGEGAIPWRRKWQPTPVFLPGKFHGQKSLEGYSPWGRKELDLT